MNWDNFRRVLDLIEANPKSWDQLVFLPALSDCGTACCLAGHAQYLAEDRHGPEIGDVIDAATAFLDLNEDERIWLFSSHRTLKDFETVLQTGKVPDWRCRS